jgi:SAM-dependent methyltransferase
MATTFNARNAGFYEQYMGRWSRRLALPFLDFAGIAANDSVLDVGCGTGSLTFVLPQAAMVREIEGVDFSPIFVEAARAANRDPRIRFSQGDACALGFADNRFDRALALLVLHFVPQGHKAIAEMRRVVRRGGVVAASVWDTYGGLPFQRIFWDAVALLDPDGERQRRDANFRPMTRPGELSAAFAAVGLAEIEEAMLTIRMDFADFADYWTPVAAGEATMGKYFSACPPELRSRIEKATREAYLSGEPDGPRSFAATAIACRGVVPG